MNSPVRNCFSPSPLQGPLIQSERSMAINDDFENILFFELRKSPCRSPDLEKIFSQGNNQQPQQQEKNNGSDQEENEIAFEFDFQYFGEDMTEEKEEIEKIEPRQCQQKMEEKKIDPIFKLKYIQKKKIAKPTKAEEQLRRQRLEALERYRQKKEKRKYSQLTEDIHQTSTIDFSVFNTF